MAYTVIKSNPILSSDRISSTNLPVAEFQIASVSDVSSLPTNVAPGSVAYTANCVNVYTLSVGGVWTKVGE